MARFNTEAGAAATYFASQLPKDLHGTETNPIGKLQHAWKVLAAKRDEQRKSAGKPGQPRGDKP